MPSHNCRLVYDPLPEHNEVLLTRERLLLVLADFSARVLQLFGRQARLERYLTDRVTRSAYHAAQIRLVVHGGAVMLLHPRFGCPRQSTRDLDYIGRSFVPEWQALGVYDPATRLQTCIDATAQAFGLGRDWANSHADVALPMAPTYATI